MPINVAPIIVSTDLDGTLLDHHTYSWDAALPALKALEKHNIPVIFNTSKTLSEAQSLQKEMNLAGPVIIENGSALCTNNAESAALFSKDPNIPNTTCGNTTIFEFGCPREKLLNFISQFRAQHGKVLEGFNDWSIEEIAKRIQLPEGQAKLASDKRYSEPFVWNSNEELLEQLKSDANEQEIKILQGGRFYHLQGNTNKATPLKWLKSIYQNLASKPTKIVCLGDNKNDIDMLNYADIPVCVKSPTSDYPQLNTQQTIIYTEELGPAGWNKAVFQILNNLNNQ